jgi:hypothetical protein
VVVSAEQGPEELAGAARLGLGFDELTKALADTDPGTRGEFLAGALPVDDERLRDVVAGIAQFVVDRYADRPLGAVAPCLIGCEAPIEVMALGTRSHTGLRRAEIRTLDDLGKARLASLAGVRGVGVTTLGDIASGVVAYALTDGRAGTDASPPLGSVARSPAMAADLAAAAVTAFRWAQALGADAGVPDPSGAPPVVRDAVALIEKALGAEPVDLASDARHFFDSLPDRERCLLVDRIGRRLTLAAIAEPLGLSRERIRQIELRVLGRWRRYCEEDAGYTYFAAVGRLRAFWSPVTRVDILGEQWPALVAPVAGTDLSPLDLLEVLDDDLVVEDGWILWKSAATVPGMTEVALRDAAPAGVIEGARAEEILAGLGISTRLAGPWLERLGWDHEQGWWLAPSCSLTDQAAVVLAHRGEPMTADEVQAALFRPGNPSSLRNQLPADARFVRSDRSHWALTVWGLPAYEGIRAELGKAIDAAGGWTRFDALLDELVDRWGVAPNSVRTFAAGPEFVRRGDMIGRRSEPPVRLVREVDPARCRRFFRDRADTWWYRLDVTEHLLAGYSTALPLGVAAHLGIAQGTSRVFEVVGHDVANHDVVLSFERQQPTLAYAGRLAKELHAREGDHLFLARSGQRLECRRIGRPPEADPALLVAALTGLPAPSDPVQAYAEVARAVDALPGLPAPELITHLARRGDQDVADVLERWADGAEPAGAPSAPIAGDDGADEDAFLTALGLAQ